MFLNVVLLSCALLFKCDAGFVDNLPKCSIKDDECMRALFQKSVRDIGKEGVPELDIDPIDPMHIANVSVTVMDAIKLILSEGVVKGISHCQFNSFHVDLEKQTGTQDITCDLTLKGSVSFGGSSPTIQSLLGTSSIEGHGKGKVKLEKVHVNFVFPFYPFKKEDGEIYFKVLNKNIKHKYSIEKATLSAEKVFLGKDDISQLIVPYFNSNWKTLMKSFGQVFVDKARDYYFDFATKFFEGIPTNKYIIEDLAPYVKN
ncbi:uncharacterized protein LOC123870113 [Maniola jurtina]|uniref:uncharacterized protein LOC123870113 n=1 Tax=Maniola jurtina TaxID=191418 RepID=UPI001E68FA0D|nr:uncharacterized protein LOC123870113 [Maniola jurtina]